MEKRPEMSQQETKLVFIIQELLFSVKQLTAEELNEIPAHKLTKIQNLVQHFLLQVKISPESKLEACNFTSPASHKEVTELHHIITTELQKILHFPSDIQISIQKNSLKSILQDILKLAMSFQKYENERILEATEKIQIFLERTFLMDSPEKLVIAFKELCNEIQDLQKIVHNYGKEFVSFSVPEIKLMFEHIYRLLSIASQTAKMKFSYGKESNFETSKQFCTNSMSFYLTQLLILLNIKPKWETFTQSTQGGNFYIPLNKLIYILRCEDTEIVDQLSKPLSEVIVFSVFVSQICKAPLKVRIMESCNRLQEKRWHGDSIKSWENFSEEYIDEIETLEKIINMAVLRLVFELSIVATISEENLLQVALKTIKENSSQSTSRDSKLQSCLSEFQAYRNQLCVLDNIIARCTSNVKVGKQLRIIAQRLEMVGEEYLTAMNEYVRKPHDVMTLYHLRLVREEWKLLAKSSNNLLHSVMDVVAFLQLAESKFKEVTNDIEDLMQENQPESLHLPVTVAIRYSKAALGMARVFMESEGGRNGRKALRMARDQVVCAIKTFKISFQKYLEEVHSREAAEKFLVFLHILLQSLQKMLSLCIEVTSSSMFEAETESSRGTNELCEAFHNATASSSIKDDKTQGNSLEFGMTDILEELSGCETFTVISNELNASSLQESILEKFDLLSDSSLLSSYQFEEDLTLKRKHVISQARNLELESRKFSGFQLLIEVSLAMCEYIHKYFHGKITADFSTNIVMLIKRTLCDVTNTRVLYELSSLMQHFEVVKQQRDMFETLSNVDVESKAKIEDVMISKTTNLLKQLIRTLSVAENCAIINRSKEQMDLVKRFRTLGFDSSLGIFNDD